MICKIVGIHSDGYSMLALNARIKFKRREIKSLMPTQDKLQSMIWSVKPIK